MSNVARSKGGLLLRRGAWVTASRERGNVVVVHDDAAPEVEGVVGQRYHLLLTQQHSQTAFIYGHFASQEPYVYESSCSQEICDLQERMRPPSTRRSALPLVWPRCTGLAAAEFKERQRQCTRAQHICRGDAALASLLFLHSPTCPRDPEHALMWREMRAAPRRTRHGSWSAEGTASSCAGEERHGCSGPHARTQQHTPNVGCMHAEDDGMEHGMEEAEDTECVSPPLERSEEEEGGEAEEEEEEEEEELAVGLDFALGDGDEAAAEEGGV